MTWTPIPTFIARGGVGALFAGNEIAYSMLWGACRNLDSGKVRSNLWLGPCILSFCNEIPFHLLKKELKGRMIRHTFN